MDIVLYFIVGIVISFIGIHLWVWIVDTFFKGLKMLIPWRKKKTQAWHTLNEEGTKDVAKDTRIKDDHIYENVE